MRRIYVTLDTEMDSDAKWVKHYPAKYTSVIDGIPNLLRPIWDRCEVHPIYFVSPEVLYEEKCIEVLKDEISKGAIIGAHLHPEYIEPDNIFGEGMEQEPAQFPCYGCSDEVEEKKIENLTMLIKEKLGVTPIWYRAARFGADEMSIQILQKLGYKYDSSVTPYIDWSGKGGPNHSRSSVRGYYTSKLNLYEKEKCKEKQNIYEMPVTILGKRMGVLGRFFPDNWLFYRWLRPTHMTYLELRSMIDELIRGDMSEAVMMFHSMEIMINKTPYVRNRIMQNYFLWRLERTLMYAKKRGYEL